MGMRTGFGVALGLMLPAYVTAQPDCGPLMAVVESHKTLVSLKVPPIVAQLKKLKSGANTKGAPKSVRKLFKLQHERGVLVYSARKAEMLRCSDGVQRCEGAFGASEVEIAAKDGAIAKQAKSTSKKYRGAAQALSNGLTAALASWRESALGLLSSEEELAQCLAGPTASPSPTPTLPPVASPSPTATVTPPPFGIYEMVSWSKQASFKLAADSLAYQQLAKAMQQGYRFELSGIDSTSRVFRIFLNEKFLVDTSFAHDADDQQVALNLVESLPEVYANIQQGGYYLPVLMPHSGVGDGLILDAPEEWPEVQTYIRFIEAGYNIALKADYPDQAALVLERSADGVVSTVGTYDAKTRIIDMLSGDKVLPHPSYPLELSTFAPGTLVHNFLSKHQSKGWTALFYGDAPQNPPTVQFNDKDKDELYLVLNSKLLIKAQGKSAKLVNDNLDTLVQLYDLPEEVLSGVLHFALRDFSISFSKSGDKYTIAGENPDGDQSFSLKGKFDQNNVTLTASPLTMNSDNGGKVELYFPEHPVLYELAGSMLDIAKYHYSGLQVSMGGKLELSHGGYLRLVFGEEYIKFYAAGYFVDQSGALFLFKLDQGDLLEIAGGTAASNTLAQYVNGNYRIAATQGLGDGDYKLVAQSDDDPYIHEITVYKNQNKSPKVNSYDPVLQQMQWNMMYYNMMSNMLAMQHQTSMSIINNIAPTPVQYVYHYY